MPARILVFEDDPAIRDLFAELIESEGYRVIARREIQVTLHDIVVATPDLIIVDGVYAADPLTRKRFNELRA